MSQSDIFSDVLGQLPSPHRVIRASAGSGKTYRLAGRYISVLRGSRPDEILATTFTRKAAGEILGRVLGRLAHAALDSSDAARLRDDLDDPTFGSAKAQLLLETLCRSLHRVSISTIDSFFNRLAMSFRHELDIPAGSRVLDESHPAIERAQKNAIEAMLVDSNPQVMLDLLRRLHHDANIRSVTNAIESIVKKLHSTYRLADSEEIWTRIIEKPERTETEIERLLLELESLRPSLQSDSRFVDALDKGIAEARAKDWRNFLGSGFGKSILNNDSLYWKKEVPEEVRAPYTTLIFHAIAYLSNQTAHLNKATYELLRTYDVCIRDEMQRHRLMTFSDIPQRLNRLDEETRTEIHFRLDSRVQHLLLDEFQDTSMEQWHVLRPFADEIVSHSDNTRSFFCVGDMKQAIYGWRGGCAEIFQQIEQDLHLDESNTQSLTKSYRSSQVVLDVVNLVFPNLSSVPDLGKKNLTISQTATQWSEAFQKHTTQKSDLPGYVELVTTQLDPKKSKPTPDQVTTTDDDDESSDDHTPPPPTGHLAFVARRIAELHQQMPDKTIAALFSTNKPASILLDHLRTLGVRASGEGGNLITDDAGVAVVLAAMTLADHPGDLAAAFHLLHSPLAAVIGIKSLALDHLQQVASDLRAKLSTLGYSKLVAHWASHDDVVRATDARNRQRLTQLIELARLHDDNPSLRPGDFVRFVSSIKMEEPTAVPVRVMTIHKSKGLEFDIVVMPELDGQRLGNVAMEPAWIERDTPTSPIVGVFRAVNETIRNDCREVREAFEQQVERRVKDQLCSLYVGMTRPRHALHLFVKPRAVLKKGDLSDSASTTAAGILRALLTNPNKEDGSSNQTLFRTGNPDWAVTPASTNPAPIIVTAPQTVRFSLAPGVRSNWRSLEMRSPSSLEASGKVKVADILSLVPSQARARGTVVHAWFEAVDFIDDAWMPSSDEELNILAHSAAPLVTPAELAKWRPAYRKMVSNPDIRQALAKPSLDPGHSTELWREREFICRVENRILRGQFDRVTVLRSPDGRNLQAHLQDFKTDTVDESSLKQTIRLYAPQMRAYRLALAQMLGLSLSQVSATLLFVGAGRVVSV